MEGGAALLGHCAHSGAHECRVAVAAEQCGALLAFPAGRFQSQEFLQGATHSLRLGCDNRCQRALLRQPAAMLAQLLAAGAGQRIFQIRLAVQVGCKLRPVEPLEHSGALLRSASTRVSAVHGRALHSHGDRVRRSSAGCGSRGDAVEHRVERFLEDVAVDDRRGQIPVWQRRNVQNLERQHRFPGTADREGPQARPVAGGPRRNARRAAHGWGWSNSRPRCTPAPDP